MNVNPMRVAAERGQLQVGTWINMVRNPAILPLLKAAGLDFARVDMEHAVPSIETIAGHGGRGPRPRFPNSGSTTKSES